MTKRAKLERSDLRAPFEAGFKEASAFGVGLEYERFGILESLAGGAATVGGSETAGAGAGRGGTSKSAAVPAASSISPLPIQGPVSVARVLEGLVTRFGWAPKPGKSPVIELSRGASRITLEPGGQMELSGAVHRTVTAAAAELGSYLSEVREVSEPLGIRWLAIGTHPAAAVEGIPWLPKKRYELMKAYLPRKGAHAHQMMKGTCGGQVNLDFADEADAMAKFQAAMGLTPIVSAMFANSPITAGKANGYLSQRLAVWLDTDPDRSGTLPFAFAPSATFDDYIDWALSVPMLFLERGDRWIPLEGSLTFAEFLERGHDGRTATEQDWELHLSTLFPDVRLKAYIEIRGTDSVPPALTLAHAALWKGLFYGGRDVLAAAYAPVAGLRWKDRMSLRRDVARLALRVEVAGRPLLEIARELIELAEAGLKAAGAGEDVRYLDPVRELTVRRGITPADELLARLRSDQAHGLGGVLDEVARIDVPD